MLLVDSNIFIYARGNHAYTPDCRALLAAAASHPEWLVPFVVLLELTHYYRDAGAYSNKIVEVFTPAETEVDDFLWAAREAESHSSINDHVILHNARRVGARGVITYDGFFERQGLFEQVAGVEPAELVG